MKYWIILFASVMTFSSCNTLLQVVEATSSTITTDEAASGLKEALAKGVETGTNLLGQENGFLGNDVYKILLPQEFVEADAKIRSTPFLGRAFARHSDKLIGAMNKGAEMAMAQAKPIFVNAITNMTFQDAVGILTGGKGAGTRYLIQSTQDQLKEKFKPVIKTSLATVNANKPWTDMTTVYNTVMKKNVNTDLADYVTDKAIEALFAEIQIQENKIRENPVERGTEILQKAFAYADKHSKN